MTLCPAETGIVAWRLSGTVAVDNIGRRDDGRRTDDGHPGKQSIIERRDASGVYELSRIEHRRRPLRRYRLSSATVEVLA